AALLASACIVPVFAQTQSGPNQVEGAVTQRGQVGSRALAYELYAYGASANDALAVVTAAAMIAKAPATETKVEKTVEGGGPSDAKKEGAGLPDLAAMIATARSLAGNNATLRGIIDDVASASPKGRDPGPGWLNSVVSAGATDSIAVTFKGGESAEVAIKGDGSTVLYAAILDENGNQICTGDDANKPGIILYCQWKPRWTGPFTIKLKNTGRVANAYR